MAEKPQAPFHQGVVKSVMSGDTIVIRGPPRPNGPPIEKTFSLSGVTAPRLGRRPQGEAAATPDEPWAWQSREFLRKKVVGKAIHFQVDYQVPSGREFGSVILEKGTAREEDVTLSAISAGWVRLREGKDAPEENRRQAATEAENAQKGVYAGDSDPAAVRDVVWTHENPRTLVDKYKGKPVEAVIEHVVNGSTVRATLLPNYEYVTIQLAGIKSPGMKRDGEKEIMEPFSEQAKYFTECRILHRDVKVLLESTNNQNFLGTILHPKGNISEFLLAAGFAKCVDWSMGVVSQGSDKLRNAEKAAKAGKVGMWKNHVSVTGVNISADEKNFQAMVEEIVNPDSLILRTPTGSKKLFLASVRPPPRGDAAGRPLYTVPYFFEAREFLRKKLIGKRVQVTLDYIKPANEGYPAKACGTVKIAGLNVAEALISKGYATVLYHKAEDEMRSSCYDDLLVAETKAKKSEKGLHSKKDAPLHKVADVSNKSQADRFLNGLQRSGKVSGVVEFVSSGSRFRIYVPKETCVLPLVLAGISCPRSARADQPGEPFGDEAYALARSACLQRDVEIEVEASDRNGNFVGHLYVGGQNIAKSLLEAGLAKLHFTADRYKNYGAYATAERVAKEAGKNIWANYVEPEAVVQDVQPKERVQDYKPVIVTEVPDATSVYVQQTAAVAQVETMLADLAAAFAANEPLPGAFTPKKNELCAAKFSGDGAWYRAKVVGLSGGKYEVLYVDYGNSEITSKDRLAPLPSVGSVRSLPPQAKLYKLALLNAPSDDWALEAKEYLMGLVLNRELLVNVESRFDGDEYVTLVTPDRQNDAAKVMLEAGYATLQPSKSVHLKALVAQYAAAQQVAHDARAGMWVYGDVRPDDAKEFGK